MLPRHHPDGIRIAFDDHRLVANAGLMLPATLARRLGLPQLADRCLDLGPRPGAGQHRRQADDPGGLRPGRGRLHRRPADALRSGGTAGVLGGTVKAPSTLGTFLRSFRWGHVRQLDRVSRELLARAWAAGSGPRRRTHSPSIWTPPLRDLPTNQRYHAAIGAPGGAYVVRSPASDMGTSW